jgi:hypothetical protein
MQGVDMSSNPGLIPGSNIGGWNISVPFQAQQGGQASLGGNVNPLLPINTSTNTSFPMMPQGAVSGSATSGFPANLGTVPQSFPTNTNTGGFSANLGAYGSAPLSGSSPGAAPPGLPGGGTGTLGTGHGYSPPGGVLGLGNLTPNQQDKLLKNLNNTFGKGYGPLIYSFLQGGAGYNQQAINNLVAGLQPGFERQSQNLLQQFSAGGNRFGSGAQIGLGDLASQQQLQVGELETQMYEQAVQNFMNVMMGVGKSSAERIDLANSQPSLIDQILGGLGGAAGGIGSLLGGLTGAASAGAGAGAAGVDLSGFADLAAF